MAAMKHEIYEDWTLLSLYDELSEHEQEALQEHLSDCETCRQRLEEQMRLNRLLDAHRLQPSPDLLDQARAQLHGALLVERMQAGRRSFWLSLTNWAAVYRAPLAAAASLVVGLAVGFVLARSGLEGEPGDAWLSPDTTFSRIELTDSNPGDGLVEVAFNAVRPVRLRGSVEDPEIQEVLAQALLNSSNPGVRLQAVGVMESESFVYDEEILEALILSLKHDENAGVRRRALNLLEAMPSDSRVRQALLYTLVNDENPGMRVAAIDALEKTRNQNWDSNAVMLKVLQDKLAEEENDYVRLRSKAFLEEVRFQ